MSDSPVDGPLRPGITTPSYVIRCRMGPGKNLEGPAMDGFGLLDRARELGLDAVMFGTSAHFPSTSEADLARVRAHAERLSLTVEYATGGIDPAHLEESLRISRALGARVMRLVVGGARLGGDRRGWEGRWQTFLATVLERLRSVMPLAERWGVCIAVENHQDLCSEELVAIAEALDSPAFGITLDTANALATVELPLEQTDRLAPWIRSVHIKDYHLVESDIGYRLVRAPIGDGAMPLAAIVARLAELGRGLCLHLELAAWEARHVRCLADDFWPEYPDRTAAQLARALAFVRENAVDPRGDWRTPWERREPDAALEAYEEDQVDRGIVRLRELCRAPARPADRS